MPDYKNEELRKVVVDLWNNGKKSSEISKNETVKSLWGNSKLNATTVGSYVGELRRTYNIDLDYRGHRKTHVKRAKRAKRAKNIPAHNNNNRCDHHNDIYKLLKVGAALRNEDELKYLTKILIEAVNNDFRKLQ